MKLDGNWAYYDTKPVHCFRLNEGIVPAALDEDLECPIHGKIKIVHTAPDLVCLVVAWYNDVCVQMYIYMYPIWDSSFRKEQT